ncbi:MAG: hypothetical protein IPG80_22300 [Anaerolineales bacterium]|uniref:hypothetical protein n=1 Tax=Candidatus Villigracilis vicinus TaxID=3140679 RepID=UPI0031352944|nr:hypothetical protein [Anaerolineales bacterium]
MPTDSPGYQSQQELIHTYLSKPVDVFLNVSYTEGTSVAMMEAVSCGISSYCYISGW